MRVSVTSWSPVSRHPNKLKVSPCGHPGVGARVSVAHTECIQTSLQVVITEANKLKRYRHTASPLPEEEPRAGTGTGRTHREPLEEEPRRKGLSALVDNVCDELRELRHNPEQHGGKADKECHRLPLRVDAVAEPVLNPHVRVGPAVTDFGA